jgi:hypothetical protein
MHALHRTNLDVALRYAAAGFRIFPCGTDKRPLVPSWAAEATKDTDRIRAWWAEHPEALVGLPMKPHDLLTFDADRHEADQDGVAHLRALCAQHEPVPPHPIVLTANGGEHHIFKQPANKIGNRKLGNGLETRGYKDDNDGGYIIAAGSKLPDGRLWRRANGAPSLLSVTLVEPPEWLADYAREKPREECCQTSLHKRTKREESYAQKALDNLARDLAAMAPESGRNDRLNIAALKLGSMVGAGWVGEATVTGRLFDACVANGLVKDTGTKAVNATIKSGLKAGLAQPHPDLQDRDRSGASREDKAAERSEPTAWQRTTTWRDGLITARALQTKTFAPVRIILPGLIPEGVTILAGKPKIGKSWLALDICAAVAGDRFVLGETKPVRGDALYLALEDNQRRLKKRTDKILQGAAGWPEALEMHTEWRRVDQGGLDDIREWCEAHSARRLIWIDTFVKIRPVAGRNEQAYGFDYRAIEGLQKLAGEYQVGIVINHHLRKASSEDDAFDDVSGTLGLTGAADTVVLMKRQAGMVKIFVRGRDIEEAEFAAEFNRTTCRWRIVGGADDVFRSQERQAIIAALKDAGTDKDGNPVPMSVAEIMAATERTDRQAIYALLHKMQRAGEIAAVGRGLYALPGQNPLSGVEIGENGTPEALTEQQAIEKSSISAADESQRRSQRNLNGGESLEIAVEIPKTTSPLKIKGSAPESQHLNDLNGSERVPTNGFGPPRGNGWHLVGDQPQGRAIVFVKEVWPPALGPPGDDVFDIDPRWRQ